MIGFVLQIIALLFAALAIGGVMLIVASVNQGRPARNGIMLLIAGIFGAIVFFIVANGILVIEPTRAAVVVNILTGDLEEPARGPGTSILLPGLQQVFTYPTDQREYTMSGTPEEGIVKGNDAVEALTIDGQKVFIDVTIIYRLDRENVNQIHLSWQDRYEEQFIRAQVRTIVRDAISGYAAESIYGLDQQLLQRDIFDELTPKMEKEGLTLSDVLIRRIQFNEQFAQSIEDKQIEEQKLKRSVTEAERIRTEAGGRADAVIEAAKGNAEATLINAKAEAEALRLISDQIAANPNLIQYEYIKTVGPNINVALIPSNSPFLFDANTFLNLGEEFTAPQVPQPNIEDIVGEEESSESDGN
ncbi:prohibitin family protein [Anaerolineales bacterium]